MPCGVLRSQRESAMSPRVGVVLFAIALGQAPALGNSEAVVVSKSAPDRTTILCANHRPAWDVRIAADAVALTYPGKGRPQPPSSTSRPIPKGVAARDVRARLPAEGGDLVAVDRGEWGGGVWWLPASGPARQIAEGRRAVALLPTPAPDVAVAVVETKLDTEIIRLALQDGSWVAEGRGVLRGAPELAEALPGHLRLLVVTSEGVFIPDLDGGTAVLVNASLGPLMPSSVATDAPGVVYIGMRLFLLRLTPTEGGYDPEWLVPDACAVEGSLSADCMCKGVK